MADAVSSSVVHGVRRPESSRRLGLKCPPLVSRGPVVAVLVAAVVAVVVAVVVATVKGSHRMLAGVNQMDDSLAAAVESGMVQRHLGKAGGVPCACDGLHVLHCRTRDCFGRLRLLRRDNPSATAASLPSFSSLFLT